MNEGMNVFRSDDNGNGWSATQIVLATGLNSINRLQHINLTQLNDGKGFYFTFNNEFVMNAVFYKQSFDEGETFVDSLYKVSYPSLFTVLDGAIVSDENNNLLCISKGKYYTNRPFDIFMKKSIDNGASWRDTLRIVQSAKDGTEIAVNKDKSGKISLLYVREDTVKFIDSSYWPTPQIHIVSNIYYKQSVDFGDTWSEEKKLTKYISDDKLSIGTSTNNQKKFNQLFESEEDRGLPDFLWSIG
ncbi:MAG: glycoside hydrolase [Ignavibacteriales bacterium]|nr:glycoside hydrolase [Ignavibacteriales bacterium]